MAYLNPPPLPKRRGRSGARLHAPITWTCGQRQLQADGQFPVPPACSYDRGFSGDGGTAVDCRKRLLGSALQAKANLAVAASKREMICRSVLDNPDKAAAVLVPVDYRSSARGAAQRTLSSR